MDADTPAEDMPAGQSTPRGSRQRTRRILVIAAIVAALILIAYLIFGHKKERTPPPAPLSVQTMTVTPHTVPDIIETSGTIISPHTVEIRPQADGVIQSVRIRDGEQVRKGQILFTIDPRPLRAALAQSRATLVRDQALLVDAADSATRDRPLAQSGALDKKTSITATNTLHSLQGTVASDRAQIDQARLSLAYTTIRAPISGRAGAVQVKAGNLVSAGSSTALVTINIASAVEVSFALPRVQVEAVRAADARQSGGLAVLAVDSTNNRPIARGRLYFLDNAFDDSSGTLTLRGRFDNPGDGLWPGQFVTVRVILFEDPNALTVPEGSLQQGQEGPYVYVLANGKAVLRQLTVARQIDGAAVITKGLKPGDHVILTVPDALRNGSSVQSSNQHFPGSTPPAQKAAASQ